MKIKNTEDVVNILNTRIKELNVTRYRIAKNTGYNRTTISRILSTETIPRIDTLIDVATTLDLEIRIIKK
jgi:DNA-binding phage protein